VHVSDHEPVSGTDRARQATAKLKREGLSILLAEQNAAPALKPSTLCTYSKGQVVYSASLDELWKNNEIKSRFLAI
jgi:ABC-type branched-subunit amino acid transport system ATPase component